MNTNQLRNLAAVGVLWLCVSAGCRKDPPTLSPDVAHSCEDGTCCMQDTRQYNYVEYIENESADLLGQTLIFKNLIPLSNAPQWYNATTGDRFKTQSAGICFLSQSKINGLKNTVPLTGSDYPFQYRVWGKIYHDPDYQTSIAIPVLFIYVDRIEEVK